MSSPYFSICSFRTPSSVTLNPLAGFDKCVHPEPEPTQKIPSSGVETIWFAIHWHVQKQGLDRSWTGRGTAKRDTGEAKDTGEAEANKNVGQVIARRMEVVYCRRSCSFCRVTTGRQAFEY